MGDILQAFFIFLALFIGTFFCGYLPSMIKAPPHVMNKISIFGGGTIVGAALIIVLPEACGILVNASKDLNELNHVESAKIVSKSSEFTMGAAMMCGFGAMMLIDQAFNIIKEVEMMKTLR